MKKTTGFPIGFAPGIRFWLFFLISLYLLGYSALFSVTLGALGGLASGLVFTWWKSTDAPSQPRSEEEAPLTERRRTRREAIAARPVRKKREKARGRYQRQSLPFPPLPWRRGSQEEEGDE